MRRLRRTALYTLGVSAFGLARVASAQVEGAGAPAGETPPAAHAGVPAAAAEVVPPSLEQQVVAVYPAEALAQRFEGTVGLELTIDETGKVVDARVISAAGHGFDESALAAARAFAFSPARQGGKPI